MNITEPKKGKITLKTNMAKENIGLELRSKDIDEPKLSYWRNKPRLFFESEA